MAEAKKKRKRNDILPCVCYFPRNPEEDLNYEDVAPEERDQKYIRFEEMSEEQKAAHKAKRERRLSKVISQYWTDHPEEYHKFCQSEMVREYDRIHFGDVKNG